VVSVQPQQQQNNNKKSPKKIKNQKNQPGVFQRHQTCPKETMNQEMIENWIQKMNKIY